MSVQSPLLPATSDLFPVDPLFTTASLCEPSLAEFCDTGLSDQSLPLFPREVESGDGPASLQHGVPLTTEEKDTGFITTQADEVHHDGGSVDDAPVIRSKDHLTKKDYLNLAADILKTYNIFDNASDSAQKTTAILKALEAAADQTIRQSRKRSRSQETSPKSFSQANKRAKKPTKSRRTCISPGAKQILEAYFSKNPYPPPEDVDDLAQRCEIAHKAVRNWFANARSRKDPSLYPSQQVPPSCAGTAELTQENIDEARRRGDSTRVSPAPSTLSLERYLASPLADEPASPAAIAGSIISRGVSPLADLTSQWSSLLPCEPLSIDFDLTRDTFWIDTPLSVVNPDVFTFGEASAPESVHSFGSYGSVASGASRGSRQGRKRWSSYGTPQMTSTSPPLMDDHIPFLGGRYECTFPGCQSSFSSRYEWVRHEESVHCPRKEWICGGAEHEETHAALKMRCECGSDQIQTGHIRNAHFESCLSKPIHERTFFRRDHLSQHLEHSHSIKILFEGLNPYLLHLWSYDAPPLLTNDPILVCRICSMRQPSWEARKAHIARHFELGVSLPRW